MKKRIISLVLAIMMVIGIFPVNIFGTASVGAASVVESGSCNSDISWTLDDEGTLTVTGSGIVPGNDTGFILAPLYEVGQKAEKLVIGEGITGTY